MKNLYVLFFIAGSFLINSFECHSNNEDWLSAVAFSVNSKSSLSDVVPTVAVDSEGNFVITWTCYRKDSWSGIFAQRYRKERNKIEPVLQVSSSHGAPAIAMDAAGNFVIPWTNSYQRYNKDGLKIGMEFQYEALADSPSVAMDAEGNFVIAYQTWNQDGSGLGVYARRFNKDGFMLGDEFLVNTYTDSNQWNHSIAMDAAGNFVIVWQSWLQDSSKDGVFAQIFDSEGNRIGSEFQVNTYTEDSQHEPSVGMDAYGNFVIAWTSQEQDGERGGIYAQRFDNDGDRVGYEFRVNTENLGNQFQPSVGMDSYGNFVVAWVDGDDYGVFHFFNIYAQRFDKWDYKIGSEFLVSESNNSSSRPSLALNDIGDLLITWQSRTVYADDRTMEYYIYYHAIGKSYKFPPPDSTPTPSGPIKFKLIVDPLKPSYTRGDSFNLLIDFKTSESQNADIFFLMLDPDGNLYYAPDWNSNFNPFIKNLTISKDFNITGASLLNITLPSSIPLIEKSGIHTFAVCAFQTSTNKFISNIAIVTPSIIIKPLVNHPWPMFMHDPQHTGRSQYKGPEVPILKRKFETGALIESSTIIGLDGTVYINSNDNYLYAINPDGTQKWNFKTSNTHSYSTPVIGSDSTVYVCAMGGYLYAIDPDGTLKWKFETGDIIESTPTIGLDDTVYVGTYWDGDLYAINSDGRMKWKFKTSGQIDSSPAIGSDGTVYVGTDDSYLYAISSSGLMKWKCSTGGKIKSSPAMDVDGTIYVGSNDKVLCSINSDGTLKWKFSTGARIESSPAIALDGTVYIGSYDRVFYAVNSDGSLKWSFRTTNCIASSPSIGSDGTVYLNGNDYYLYAINPDGTEKWRFQKEFGGDRKSSPAIGSDGAVYINSRNDIWVLGEDNTEATYEK